MAIVNYRMMIHELLNKDLEIVPEVALMIALDIKSDIWMAKNGKNTRNTRHIKRRMYLVRNVE